MACLIHANPAMLICFFKMSGNEKGQTQQTAFSRIISVPGHNAVMKTAAFQSCVSAHDKVDVVTAREANG